MTTRVVNLRTEPYDVYIGRAGHGQDGYFGNPIAANTRCPICERGHRAEETLQCYSQYLTARLQTDPEFRQRVASLRGKTLGCFCKPRACHGDILVQHLEGSLMRLAVLDDLIEATAGCESCALHIGRSQVVFERGSHSASVMLVGEQPEECDDVVGVPFTGPSGKLLDEIITQSMRLTIEDVYICLASKCRPFDGRPPSDEELVTCGSYLEAQIEAIKPKIIIALGKSAAFALGCDTTRGWAGRWGRFDSIPVMPTFSPNYVLQHDNRPAVWSQMSSHLKAALAKLRE